MPLLDNSLLIVLPGGTLPVGGASPGAVAAIASDLAAETTARQQADTAEATARQQADTTLDTNRRDAVANGDVVKLRNVGGTANAITAEIPTAAWFSGITSFVNLRFELVPIMSNTRGPTLILTNTGGTFELPIYDRNGDFLLAGDLKAGVSYLLTRWGNTFRIMNAEFRERERALRGVQNRSADQLPNWRRKRGAVRQNKGRATVLCIGASNTVGWSTDGVGNHNRSQSYVANLARCFSDLRGTWANVMGRSLTGAVGYTSYDPRVSWTGTGWSPAGVPSLGGEAWLNDSTDSVWSFAPGIVWDTAKIWFIPTADGVVEISAGEVVEQITLTANQPIEVIASPQSAGAHVLTMTRISGQVQFMGMDCHDSRVAGVSFINAGRSGWRSAQYADATQWYSPLNQIATVKPDLVIIQLGTNDWNQSYSPNDGNTFMSSMQALIDTCKAAGSDAIVLVPMTPNAGSQTHSWSSYRVSFYALADASNVPLVDTGIRFGSFAEAQADGLITDALHPNFMGLADMAAHLHNLLSQ